MNLNNNKCLKFQTPECKYNCIQQIISPYNFTSQNFSQVNYYIYNIIYNTEKRMNSTLQNGISAKLYVFET